MNADELRGAVQALDLLLIALGCETERHSSECPCRWCTAAMATNIAHSQLAASPAT